MAAKDTEAEKFVEKAPPPTIREEMLDLAEEWQTELQSQAPSEFLTAELILVSMLVTLLTPTATHYQT